MVSWFKTRNSPGMSLYMTPVGMFLVCVEKFTLPYLTCLWTNMRSFTVDPSTVWVWAAPGPRSSLLCVQTARYASID